MRTLAVLLLLIPSTLCADELRFDARRLFHNSTNQHLHLVGDAIELDAGVLLEDDGPAAGFTYAPNEEKLSGTVWAKKELIVANPKARRATLLVAPGGKLRFQINGRPIEASLQGKVGQYWQAYDVPVSAWRSGKNDIVLQGDGKLWIAHAEDFSAGSTSRTIHPNRSARSSDGGKTWDYDKLGPAGAIDGEYYVRLFLDQHFSQGTLTTPVIDAANLAGAPIAAPVAELGSIRITAATATPSAAGTSLRARSGPTLTPDATWSKWQELDSAGVIAKPVGRFVQVAVELSTTDPLVTPQLRQLLIQATPRRSADWTSALKVVEARQPALVRSSIPFRYEPFDHPKLQQFRERFRLDEVVKDAKTDLEIMTRLAAWSARQWDKGHLKDSYPAWDALAILAPHADGTPTGGFCQQYNLVLLQACAAYGLPGRAVSIGLGDHHPLPRGGGHEVVEIWSNQQQKWVYMDGNTAWYLVDADSGVPLSLWELRQRQLAAGKEAASPRVVVLGPSRFEWKGLQAWPPFLELRLIPRSNFLEEKTPLPLRQGMRGWFWTGHHVWSDHDSPASLIYSQRIQRPGDWNWTLNQTQFVLEAGDQAGQLRVHLDTVTPGFSTFLADVAGQPVQPVKSGFTWPLKRGRNELQLRTLNTGGREGIPSSVVLEY